MADQIQSGVDDIAQIEARNEVLRRDIARGEAKLLEARAKTVAERVSKQQSKSGGSTSMADAVAGATSPRYQMDVPPEIDFGPSKPPTRQRTIHTVLEDNLAKQQAESAESPSGQAKELSKDFKALRVPIAAAISAVYAFSRAANEAAVARTSGAMDVADVRKSLSSSLQTLGVGGADAESIIQRTEAGGYNGISGSPTSVAKFLQKAAGAKGSSPMKADITGLLRVMGQRDSGQISDQTLDQFLSTPGALNMPGAALDLAKLGTGDWQAPSGTAAASAQAMRDRSEYASKRGSYTRGQAGANRATSVENMVRDWGTAGSVGKFAYDYAGGKAFVDTFLSGPADAAPGSGLQERNVRANEESARNSRPPPPSTTAGR